MFLSELCHIVWAFPLMLLIHWKCTWWGATLTFILFGPVLLLSVLLHSLGHCVAYQAVSASRTTLYGSWSNVQLHPERYQSPNLQVGGRIKGLWLSPLGGQASIDSIGSPAKVLIAAVAGSLTHVVQLGVWYLILIFSYAGLEHTWDATLQPPWPKWWLALCALACRLEIIMLCSNLLSPWPHEGGRISSNLLLLCRVPVRVADMIMISITCFNTGILLGLYICYIALCDVALNDNAHGPDSIKEGTASVIFLVRSEGCCDWDGETRLMMAY